MVDFMGSGNDIILSVNKSDTLGSIISVTGEKKVTRKGSEIVQGYIDIFNKMADLYPDECFPDTLKGTDWKIVLLRGEINFFIPSSEYSFGGLSVDESITEMKRYVNRKAKGGDAIYFNSENSNFPAYRSPIYSYKRLIVFKGDDNGNKKGSSKIEFILPDLKPRHLKDYIFNKCTIGVVYKL